MSSLRLAIRGPDYQRSYDLSGPFPIWIGRDPCCEVSIAAHNVSRRHLALAPTAEGLEVTDASTNGTRVNGELLRRASRRLCGAATLEVGSFAVVVENKVRSQPVDRRSIHRRLLENLDLAAMHGAAFDPVAMRPRVIEALTRILGEEAGEDLGELGEQLILEITDEALGLGPLERLLADPEISEIMVVDPFTLFVERRGKIELTPLRFTDEDSVRAVIERIVTPMGRRIDESTPLVDARLKDGSRVNAVIPPLALRGPTLTIRKFRKDPLSLEHLVGFGSLSAEMARFLERSVRVRKNIVISGGTGSGKTTLLNVLSGAIPHHERVVTVEDAAELKLAQPHVVALEARPPNLEGKGEYSIRDLVKNALRMRPDRIVVGECRGGEALDMLQAMNTGHEGSLTTTHANSPEEAVARIETLCLMSGLELPIFAIRRQITSSIHLFVQQTRYADGSRRVSSIAEVVGQDDDGQVELREIYQFEVHRVDANGTVQGEFVATGYLPTFLDEFVVHGLADEGAPL